MGVKVESTWMETQKHATVMSPGKDFQVIQANDGTAIFFSIGTDDTLYATKETQASKTGWERIDLSSGLSKNLNVAGVKAKAFTVSQNLQSMAFDLGLVVTASGFDHLFLSFGNSENPTGWTNVQWKQIPFDGADRSAPSPLTIDGVYLVNLPSPRNQHGTQTCFVDIFQKPPASNPMKLLDRYYVSLKEAPFWHKHTLLDQPV